MKPASRWKQHLRGKASKIRRPKRTTAFTQVMCNYVPIQRSFNVRNGLDCTKVDREEVIRSKFGRCMCVCLSVYVYVCVCVCVRDRKPGLCWGDGTAGDTRRIRQMGHVIGYIWYRLERRGGTRDKSTGDSLMFCLLI